MDNLTMKFERKKLYDEIWDISLTGVSKKYRLNYTKLVQVCKENNIPYPSSAYWTKKNMGLDYSTEIVEFFNYIFTYFYFCCKISFTKKGK